MNVRPYTDADLDPWDELIRQSHAGNFLHSRRFLSHHGDRFVDLSLVCEDDKGRIFGVFPAALDPDDESCVTSHPGSTYGGLLCMGGRTVDQVDEAMSAVLEHHRSKGLSRIVYKSVPPHLHASWSQADIFALWRKGATVARRDLWIVVALHHPVGSTKLHRWCVEKARKREVVVRKEASDESYRTFHGILEQRLAERYDTFPVHTAEGMLVLRERFPDQMDLWLARSADGDCLAGSWVFKFEPHSWHTQYVASTKEGRDACASHLLFDRLIREATEAGASCLSLGCCSEEDGKQLNSGLCDFKTGFGGGTVAHDFYHLDL